MLIMGRVLHDMPISERLPCMRKILMRCKTACCTILHTGAYGNMIRYFANRILHLQRDL